MVKAKGREARSHAESHSWGYTHRGKTSDRVYHGGGDAGTTRRRKRSW